MSRLSEADLQQFRRNMQRPVKFIQSMRMNDEQDLQMMLQRGTHPLKAMDKLLKQKGPVFKSKWEQAYSHKLELEKRAGLIKQYWYEPFSLWLPGKVRFKPDFMVQYPDRGGPGIPMSPIEVIEVKGWSKNRRDGITRLKVAAALFPCFVWRIVWMKKGGHFDGEYI